MKIEYVNPNDIKPYKRNARKHGEEDIEAIKASIEKVGFRDPIGVWKNTIVEGHGRQIAALELGLDRVPIIRLDDMTDEERRTYALAHNRTAELSEWEDDILKSELKALHNIGIDMTEFGFDMPEADDEEDEEEEEEYTYYGEERERTFDGYKLEHYDANRTAGRFDLPILERCDYVPHDLIGFNYVLNTSERDKGVHFFLDDYQFERVWNEPMFYIQKLTEFPCMCTPDFSLYTDMPLAMKIWNVYRSRLIGQIAADRGIEVIPTLQWAGDDTLDWVFEGIEKGGTVCTSTVGAMRDKEALKLWKIGMERALIEVEPTTLVLYGTDVDFDFGNVNVVKIASRKFTK